MKKSEKIRIGNKIYFIKPEPIIKNGKDLAIAILQILGYIATILVMSRLYIYFDNIN